MEGSMNPRENRNPPPVSSPDSRRSSNSSSSSSSSTTHSNGPATAAPPPVLPVTRSEPNSPYPTTFVQADASSFKQVVQMLTGSPDPAKPAAVSPPSRNPIPPVKAGVTKKEKSASKLYERRNSLKNFKLNPLGPGFGLLPGRPGLPEILSPSILDFPSLVLSPVSPLIPDPFNRPPHAAPPAGALNMEAEEKAIAKKGFYFHPSPANTPKDSEPRLLPLFPLTSPRISDSANSDS
ncbi:PREDICTED: VQ motif-containing protein 4-like [Ipomoea nil]|uniref:VQ motif-containing protein 4-like n=1 Tax=Ipomoea nil TaxID=35883 RepID=UPI000900B1E9|nr:PREDICTED: VQ motif-containing protein 4-like [Ipomoea nil]